MQIIRITKPGNLICQWIGFFVFAMSTFTPVALFGAISCKTQTFTSDTSYQNFDAAIYCSVQDMRRMAADSLWLKESWDVIHRSIKVDKVWPETYRGNQQTPEADIRIIKDFFASKGIKTQGGMMPYVGRPGDRITV